MSPSDLGVFVLASQGTAKNEAGGSSAMKGNTETTVKQAVCTGARNLRALTRVSLRGICGHTRVRVDMCVCVRVCVCGCT